MKILNRLVFGGLILCGSLLLVGMMLNKGSLMGLGTYLGWFFAVFSMIAYLIASIRQATHPRTTYWMDLYPTNFGLALVGISVFGFTGQENILVLIATLLIAVAIPFVTHRLAVGRTLPLAVLGLLFVPVLPWVKPFWMYLYLVVGVALISMSIFQRLVWKNNNRGQPV